MFKLIFTCVVAMAFFSASAMPQPAMSIKVSGEVRGIPNETPNTLIINECDICNNSARCIVEIDSAGRFDVSLPFYYGHTFTVNINRMFINAYAEPGDSIFVSIDTSKSPMEFHLSGAHAGLNEEYSHALSDLSHIYFDVNLPADTVPLSVYMPKFKSEVARTKAIVDKYVEEKSLRPETVELLRLDNIFIIANLAIGFVGNGKDEQIAFFTDSLFDISNEHNVKVMIFPYHLSALMMKSPEYINKMPKSVIRDLMYAAHEDCNRPSRDDFANVAYYDRVYDDETRPVDLSGIKPGRIVVMENDTVCNIDNVNPVEWLKQKFPSQPVYLDISATWCGPCRAALSEGESLRRHFSNSDIVFAVIWLKSDMDSWSVLAPKFGNAIHIFVPDEDMSNRVMGSLNMQGFPSYYFIDRNGKMSAENIPHFNNPDLIDFLQSKCD